MGSDRAHLDGCPVVCTAAVYIKFLCWVCAEVASDGADDPSGDYGYVLRQQGGL